jgi:energy-coupling factor transport system substrate-specific component
VLTRGRLHRIPLAGVCFVVGFGFTVLQDVGDWVTYSDHGLAALGAYVGQGLGFDLIHAIGCAGFALAFGPALIHSLSRFRLRLTVTWVCRGAAILVGGWGLAHGWVSSGPAEVGVAQAAALPAGTPAHYLLAAQNADGGFGAAPGQASESLFSGWAALGLAADGVDPATTRRAGGRTLLAYLEAHSGRDTGSLERSILALAVARGPVAALAGELSRRVRADGSLAGQTNLTAFAILALRAGGLRVPARMVAWLARQQDPDGGFNFATAGGASDVDDTGAVLEALAGAGRAAATRRAVRFLEAQENRDGGFPSSPGGSSNAQSTAFAVQGLLASHHAAPRALGYLRRLTAPDGHVAYAAGANQTPVWVTAQAMLALAGRPLPLAALPPPTVAAVPVARKPPARRAALRQAARPRRSHGLAAAPRPAPDLGALAGAAGALAALALAPVGDP